MFFEKNQPVHIISRAVEGIKIFEREEDCYRFIFHFQAANLGKRGLNVKGIDATKAGKSLLQGEEISQRLITTQHIPLVHLLDFSLVMNHYHFYLLPNIENSLSLFMQKLNNGFAKYYNLKHNRKDALFGSRYKSILVETEFQSDAVSRYINIINPLDVFQPGWRVKGLTDWEEASTFLNNYQFSSFPDKVGQRNSKILAPAEILERYSFKLDNKEDYQKFTEEFLRQKLISFQPLFLE